MMEQALCSFAIMLRNGFCCGIMTGEKGKEVKGER
ncbi:MAG: hypothetical protein GDYSWBUE_001191 [Candidatus Fervidibacterota bacterium]